MASDLMLVPGQSGPSIVVCTTCRGPDGAEGSGGRLAALLDDRAAGGRIAVEPMPCLFACAFGCAVHLRAPGKIGYVLGRFTPDTAAARAILDYMDAYADSADGEVAFDRWPAGVMGHFIVRLPPPAKLIA